MKGLSHLSLGLGVGVFVALLVVPLPFFAIDAFLSTSLALALLVLLMSLYAKDPLELSAFPSFLLVLTLFRLSLNIATTRLILSEAYSGQMITAFGEFVSAGSPLIGLVLFLLLTAVNFLVITKGTARIAEVSARFTLDAMPGKQMSLEQQQGDFRVSHEELSLKRKRLEEEADFYGAMDGAAKFVRGDAIAGLVVTFINLVGGVLAGLFTHHMSFIKSVETFSILTIGDGLITQIPALLVSVGAGVMVTKASSRSSMSDDLKRQLFSNPEILKVVAALLVFIALLPGMPTPILLALAGLFFLLSTAKSKPVPSKAPVKKDFS